MRFFNTSGPVVPADHYCIPPLERMDLDDTCQLVRNKRYFVLHAPRQTGKTSFCEWEPVCECSGVRNDPACAFIRTRPTAGR